MLFSETSQFQSPYKFYPAIFELFLLLFQAHEQQQENRVSSKPPKTMLSHVTNLVSLVPSILSEIFLGLCRLATSKYSLNTTFLQLSFMSFCQHTAHYDLHKSCLRVPNFR